MGIRSRGPGPVMSFRFMFFISIIKTEFNVVNCRRQYPNMKIFKGARTTYLIIYILGFQIL